MIFDCSGSKAGQKGYFMLLINSFIRLGIIKLRQQNVSIKLRIRILSGDDPLGGKIKFGKKLLQ